MDVPAAAPRTFERARTGLLTLAAEMGCAAFPDDTVGFVIDDPLGDTPHARPSAWRLSLLATADGQVAVDETIGAQRSTRLAVFADARAAIVWAARTSRCRVARAAFEECDICRQDHGTLTS